jgi:hypothetical protein
MVVMDSANGHRYNIDEVIMGDSDSLIKHRVLMHGVQALRKGNYVPNYINPDHISFCSFSSILNECIFMVLVFAMHFKGFLHP